MLHMTCHSDTVASVKTCPKYCCWQVSPWQKPNHTRALANSNDAKPWERTYPYCCWETSLLSKRILRSATITGHNLIQQAPNLCKSRHWHIAMNAAPWIFLWLRLSVLSTKNRSIRIARKACHPTYHHLSKLRRFRFDEEPTSRSYPFCLSEIIHDVLSYLVSKQRIRCIEQQIPASTTMKHSETLFHQSSACLGYSQRAVCLSKARTFHLPTNWNTYIILHQFFSAGESLLHNFSIHFLAELLRLEKIVLWVAGLFWTVTIQLAIRLSVCVSVAKSNMHFGVKYLEHIDTCTCIQGIWSRILQAAKKGIVLALKQHSILINLKTNNQD